MADLPDPPYGDEEVEAPRSAAHEKARKINPAYTEGELVRVAWGPNQAAAELIQGMLLEEGVPSVLRRSMGFDVPDFLAGGPRDILVPASGAEAARERLDTAGVDAPQMAQEDRPLRRAIAITVAIVTAAGVTALIAWLALQSGA